MDDLDNTGMDEAEMMSQYEEYMYTKSIEGFCDWIKEHYPVGNGITLVELQEDVYVKAKYLHAAGLPADTQLDEGERNGN